MKHCIVLTACKDLDHAKKLAKSILEARLAACVQLSNIESLYWWKNNLEDNHEVKLEIKTRTDLYERLEKHIRENHDYEVPEIVMLRIEKGSASFLDWIDEETGS